MKRVFIYMELRWLIDWLIDWRQASSISAIFGKRTRSIIYKNYIEMREGMDQPGQQFLTATLTIEEIIGIVML
jgi:hypothetical protein